MPQCRAQGLEGSRVDNGQQQKSGQGRLYGEALRPDLCFSSSGPVFYLAIAWKPGLQEPGYGLRLWLPLP